LRRLERVLVEVEVGGVELGEAFESSAVEDPQVPVLELDKPAAAELL